MNIHVMAWDRQKKLIYQGLPVLTGTLNKVSVKYMQVFVQSFEW